MRLPIVLVFLLFALNAQAQHSLKELFRGGQVTFLNDGPLKVSKLESYSDLQKFSKGVSFIKIEMDIFIPKVICDSLHSMNIGIINDQDKFYLNNVLAGATGDFATKRRMVNTNRNYLLSPALLKCDQLNKIVFEIRRLIGSRIGPDWDGIRIESFSVAETNIIYSDVFLGLHKEIAIFLFSLTLILFGLFKGHKDFPHLVRLCFVALFGAGLSITLSGWLYYFIDFPEGVYKINALMAIATLSSFLYYLIYFVEPFSSTRSKKVIALLIVQILIASLGVVLPQSNEVILACYKVSLLVLLLETVFLLWKLGRPKNRLDRRLEFYTEVFIGIGMTCDILRIYNVHSLPNVSIYFIAIGVSSLAFLAVSRLIDEIDVSQKVKLTAKVADVARQVAHDIRSPLSALNMVVSVLHEVPEEKRTILRNVAQRINDIANNVIRNHQMMDVVSVGPAAYVPFNKSEILRSTDLTMLAAAIDTIVSEKRIQYRNRQNLEIEIQYGQAYGLFAEVNPSILSRVLSNLINNSVEAIGDAGKIVISLDSTEHQIVISCVDNGRGIPPSILSKLGMSGITYGKKGTGNGLGIPHAKNAMESYGGRLEIESVPNQGTKVSLVLPRAKTPSWFTKNLDLKTEQILVSIDDDQTIHQIWQERLASEGDKTKGIKHLTFSNVENAETWWISLPDPERKSVQFLVDYEFYGKSGNGLDFIETLNCMDRSTLVTSRFDELLVRYRAENLGVRIIPKGLSPLVPIVVRDSSSELP